MLVGYASTYFHQLVDVRCIQYFANTNANWFYKYNSVIPRDTAESRVGFSQTNVYRWPRSKSYSRSIWKWYNILNVSNLPQFSIKSLGITSEIQINVQTPVPVSSRPEQFKNRSGSDDKHCLYFGIVKYGLKMQVSRGLEYSTVLLS